MFECTVKEKINWIHTMGDSQEREFVASMKTVNNDTGSATKFENVDFTMHDSPNNLRVTWQFYVESFLWHDGFSHPRSFATDQKIFDHFNIRPSEVWFFDVPLSAALMWEVATGVDRGVCVYVFHRSHQARH